MPKWGPGACLGTPTCVCSRPAAPGNLLSHRPIPAGQAIDYWVWRCLCLGICRIPRKSAARHEGKERGGAAGVCLDVATRGPKDGDDISLAEADTLKRDTFAVHYKSGNLSLSGRAETW